MKSAPHLVLYDDACPFCTFQMRLLTWLDWLNVLAPVPLSDPRVATLAPQLTREALLEAIHCITARGDVHRGARALRFLGLRLPLLVPVALVLWIPGVIQAAEWIYRWVSRHRYLISRLFGCKTACSLLPERRRKPGDER